jgi:hypothetical protein
MTSTTLHYTALPAAAPLHTAHNVMSARQVHPAEEKDGLEDVLQMIDREEGRNSGAPPTRSGAGVFGGAASASVGSSSAAGAGSFDPSADPGADPVHLIQWAVGEPTKFRLTEEGCAFLRALPSDMPVAVISVIGPMREGKVRGHELQTTERAGEEASEHGRGDL